MIYLAVYLLSHTVLPHQFAPKLNHTNSIIPFSGIHSVISKSRTLVITSLRKSPSIVDTHTHTLNISACSHKAAVTEIGQQVNNYCPSSQRPGPHTHICAHILSESQTACPGTADDKVLGLGIESVCVKDVQLCSISSAWH